MDDTLYFNEQHLLVREMVRSFANDHVKPVASLHDADVSEWARRTGQLWGSQGRALRRLEQ